MYNNNISSRRTSSFSYLNPNIIDMNTIKIYPKYIKIYTPPVSYIMRFFQFLCSTSIRFFKLIIFPLSAASLHILIYSFTPLTSLLVTFSHAVLSIRHINYIIRHPYQVLFQMRCKQYCYLIICHKIL